jgi:phage tail-like protein
MGLLGQTGIRQKTSSPETPSPSDIAPLKDDKNYPVSVYQFAIEIDGSGGKAVTVAYFQSLGGMQVSRKVEPLNEGGLNNYGHEFPGQISYGHVTFTAGLSSCDFFWKWMMDGQYDGYAHKKNFTLVQRNTSHEEAKRWNFFNAFPVSWKINSMDVSIDTSKVVIETLELSFEYFELAEKPQP